MNIIKVFKFLTINVFLLYIVTLLYDSYIWVSSTMVFYSQDTIEGNKFVVVIVFIVILNTIDFAGEIIKGSD